MDETSGDIPGRTDPAGTACGRRLPIYCDAARPRAPSAARSSGWHRRLPPPPLVHRRRLSQVVL